MHNQLTTSFTKSFTSLYGLFGLFIYLWPHRFARVCPSSCAETVPESFSVGDPKSRCATAGALAARRQLHPPGWADSLRNDAPSSRDGFGSVLAPRSIVLAFAIPLCEMPPMPGAWLHPLARWILAPGIALPGWAKALRSLTSTFLFKKLYTYAQDRPRHGKIRAALVKWWF